MPLSITARLLCAARHAYNVTATGPVADTPDSTRIGFVGTVDGFVDGPDGINAALVGEAPDAIVVAFRGTLPPGSPNPGQVILDWANDVDALLMTDPGGLPGNVHQGFLGALDSLWPAMEPVVKSRSTASPAKPIYVTGHSKGGPLANLAAMRLRAALPTTPVMVATFAGARPGDEAFAAAYDAAIPHGARYEYADDIVPHLPPSDEFVAMFKNIPEIGPTVQKLTLGYASVGDLHFIDWDGNFVPDTPLLRLERFASLAKLLVTFGFATIVADHSIEVNKSGYDKAIEALPA
ncbi:MAG: lipase family protein [Alphaproteobacteria bacterium]